MSFHVSSRFCRYFISAEFALLLSACASDADIKPSSTVADPGGIRVGTNILRAAGARPSTTIVATGDWWEGYGDPQLARLLSGALNESPSIELAEARLRRAEAMLNREEAGNKPSIVGSAQIDGDRFPGHYLYPAPYAGNWGSDGSLTASVRYSLDFWGKRHEAIAAANAPREVPVQTRPVLISQAWHPRMGRDPGHRELRTLMYQACQPGA